MHTDNQVVAKESAEPAGDYQDGTEDGQDTCLLLRTSGRLLVGSQVDHEERDRPIQSSSSNAEDSRPSGNNGSRPGTILKGSTQHRLDTVGTLVKRIHCTSKPPHNLHNEVNIGELSIIFSYGRVAGYSYAGETFITLGAVSSTQRLLNRWQPFKSHQPLPRQKITLGLLAALQQESALLINAATESTMHQKEGTPLLAASLDDELEQLDEDAGTIDDDEDFDDLEDDDDEDDDGTDEDDDEDDLDDEPEDDALGQDQY